MRTIKAISVISILLTITSLFATILIPSQNTTIGFIIGIIVMVLTIPLLEDQE